MEEVASGNFKRHTPVDGLGKTSNESGWAGSEI